MAEFRGSSPPADQAGGDLVDTFRDGPYEPLYRSNINQTSYLRKILQYRQVMQESVHKTHWGVPNLMVLNLTTSEPHKGKMIQLVKDLSGGRGKCQNQSFQCRRGQYQFDSR